MNTTRVGLVGLGNMGDAICSRLTTAFDVVGYDVDVAARERARQDHGIKTVDTIEGLQADVVVLSLPRPEISLAASEAIATSSPNGLIIETSTLLPAHVQAMRDRVAGQGWAVVDAAVLSGVEVMRSGKAMLLVGGDPDDVERAATVLETMSAEQVNLGASGAGMAAKVINNAVAHVVYVVLAEAFLLADRTGVDREALVAMLARDDGGLVRPLQHRIRERYFAEDYAGGMPTDAALKDSLLAIELGTSERVALFTIQAAHSVYQQAVAAGFGRDDYAGVVRVWFDRMAPGEGNDHVG